ncbi:MAG TPA: glycosyltransferase family 2 protein [Candidatus Paceibacterota bacterium]|nr:glycosyltransferase family 2 protein [Candidatus Paceibacterota bacterium]
MEIRNEELDISIVIPVFNEEEVLPTLLAELYRVCGSLKKRFEFIFVDDGSYDGTPEVLRTYADRDPRVKVLVFSRNFGHQAALSAGINVAEGEMVVTMDSDLQHPPTLVPEFIAAAEAGADIVIGQRILNAKNSYLREIARKLFYRFLSFATNLEFKNASDFVLYKKQVIRVIRRMPEKERFFRGIVQWIGFKKKYIPYAVEARRFGHSKYSMRRLLYFIASGVTSFSAFPLRIALWIGALIFLFSIGFSGYTVWDHYVNPDPLNTGNSTIIILVLFLGGVQMLVLGITGEYLYRMFNEIKGRPLYIVAEMRNMDQVRMDAASQDINAM